MKINTKIPNSYSKAKTFTKHPRTNSSYRGLSSFAFCCPEETLTKTSLSGSGSSKAARTGAQAGTWRQELKLRNRLTGLLPQDWLSLLSYTTQDLGRAVHSGGPRESSIQWGT